MNYTELKLHCPQEDADTFTAVLEELVPGGFSVDDPRDFADLLHKEHDYDWDYVSEALNPENRPAERANTVTFTIYLNDTPEGLEQLDSVLTEAAYRGIEDTEIRPASDDEWKDQWKAYFKPAKVSRSIVVKPTWEPYEAREGEKIIEIDPGMAFGTGTHETTSLCIKALETYLPRCAEQIEGPVAVLDVGCGSGILSFAAAKLQPDAVILGVDIDPVAVEVSKENAALNRMDTLLFRQGDLTKDFGDEPGKIRFKAHAVVANLMADLVILLSGDVRRVMHPGGIYISSGILTEKLPQVRAAVEEAGFIVLETPIDGEWCCIVAQNR